MSKHTVLVAVTVDSKYDAGDVASEINYFLPFITSECMDTIVATIPARIKNQVKSYVVWNADHIALYAAVDGDYDYTTYEGLLGAEKETDSSFSTYISTDDIQSIVTAVQNEWNGDLQYKELS